jgi:hypothetical protein
MPWIRTVIVGDAQTNPLYKGLRIVVPFGGYLGALYRCNQARGVRYLFLKMFFADRKGQRVQAAFGKGFAIISTRKRANGDRGDHLVAAVQHQPGNLLNAHF